MIFYHVRTRLTRRTHQNAAGLHPANSLVLALLHKIELNFSLDRVTLLLQRFFDAEKCACYHAGAGSEGFYGDALPCVSFRRLIHFFNALPRGIRLFRQTKEGFDA